MNYIKDKFQSHMEKVANNQYQKMNFDQKETNVDQYPLPVALKEELSAHIHA